MSLRPRHAAEVADTLREAHDAGTTLRVVAHATWPQALNRVSPSATTLDTTALSGITAYVPGDLTLTALAATPLAEINAAAAAEGQWCPLLPWGDDAASVAAVFATATSGPFAGSLGRPRDLALGLEFVDGTGALVRAGGKVVKNVAGFDLTRLLVGSWGTLGIITEVTIRLRARPRVDESWALRVDRNDPVASRRLAAFTRGPLAPLAVLHVDESVRADVGMPGTTNTLARIGGNTSFVAASRRALEEIGALDTCDPAVWEAARRHCAGSAPPDFSLALRDPLAQRIQRQFDPRGILNPGMMGVQSA